MNQALDPGLFVPALVQSALADGRLTDGPSRLPLTAAVLFADVSGFSARTTALAAQGPDAIEQFSDELNHLFALLLNESYRAGGDAVSFAGDAVMILFPVPEADGAERDAGLRDVVRSAHAAATRVQRQITERGGDVHMRIGIDVGPVDLHIASAGRERRLTFPMGAAIAGAAAVQADAGNGTVSTTAAVDDLLRGSAAVVGTAAAGRIERPVADTVPLLPLAVASRIDAGGWIAEVRQLSLLFARLPIRAGDSADAVEAVMAPIGEVLDEYEGTSLGVSVDEKGAVLVAAFGLPPLSHEDDALRSVLAAMAITEHPALAGAEITSGVAGGWCFCGLVGTEDRRHYLVLAESANRAARLAGIPGPGRVRCSDDIRVAAGAGSNFSLLGVHRLKGWDVPTPVFAPSPGDDSIQPGTIGRRRQFEVIRERLDRLQADSGSVVLIEGEPGMGKSSLAAAAVGEAQRRGLRTLIGRADGIHQQVSYGVWRGVIRELVGLAPTADARDANDEVRASVLTTIEALVGDLAGLAPLADAAVGIGLADSPRTAQMDAASRASATTELLTRLIVSASEQTPTVILLEDLHWMDSASQALLRRLTIARPPLLGVATTRPTVGRGDPFDELIDGLHRIHLGPMSPSDIGIIAAEAIHAPGITAEAAEALRRHTGGNPFFALETIRSLAGSGQIERGTDGSIERIDAAAATLPASLLGLLIANIDRLDVGQQLTLKVVAVAGGAIGVDDVAAVHPLTDDVAKVTGLLNELTLDGLLTRDASAYRPRHAIAQEAAYSLLTPGQQRDLHSRLGRRLAGRGDASPEELARHFLAAGLEDDAMPHLARAGKRAFDAGAYREAAALYEDAVAIAARSDLDRLTIAGWYRELGETYIAMGWLDESRRAMQAAVHELGIEHPRGSAGFAAGISREFGRQVWQLARGHRPARRAAAQLDESESARQHLSARIHEDLAQVYLNSEDVNATFFCGLRHANLGQSAADPGIQAKAYATMMPLAGYLRLHGVARIYQRRTQESLDAGGTLNDRGLAREYEALYMIDAARDWDATARVIDEMLEAFVEVGNDRRVTEALMIRCAMHLRRHDLTAMLADAETALTTALRIQDRQALANASGYLASAHLRRGEPDKAIAALASANEIGPRLAQADIILVGSLAAAAHGQLNEPAAAATQLRRALTAMRPLPVSPMLLEAYAAASDAALRLHAAHRASDAELKVALTQLKRFSMSKVSSQPRAAIHRGIHATMLGRAGRAERIWNRGLKVARRADLPYERMVLEQLLGIAEHDVTMPWHPQGSS